MHGTFSLDTGLRPGETLTLAAMPAWLVRVLDKPQVALLAAKAGATYLSPFIGRVDDISWDGSDLIDQIVHIYNLHAFETQVLAASIRNPLHIVKCAEVGADVVTCPLSAILALLNHPLTDIGLAKFLADHKKVNG